MSKARDLADFISTGSILSDGTIESTEINGVTADASELNVLDGITVTTQELNNVAGISTSVQTQLDGKQDVVTGVSDTEIGYLDGVTSNLQTQLDNISVTSGSLTKSFTSGETASITLAQAISPAPVVSATKEVPQVGISSKGAWDVNASASNYELHDTAYDTTLTPSSVTTLGDISDSTYSNQTFSVSNEGNLPADVNFKTDGTKMYVFDRSSGVHQYSLSTAWDVSTASYDSVSFTGYTSYLSASGNEYAFTISTDGYHLYIIDAGNANILQFTMSTAWDVSTASYVRSYTTSLVDVSVFFKPDGTKFYGVSQSNNQLFQFDLTTAWDISTASYTGGNDINYGSLSTGGQYALLNSTGTKVYILTTGTTGIYQYSLSTAWDLSTATYDNSTFDHSTTSSDRYCFGMFLRDNGDYYLPSNNNDSIHKLSFGVTTNALTLGTGSFASTDVGKRIQGNGGDVTLTSTAGAYDTTGGSAFTDSSTIASGSWSMRGLKSAGDADGIGMTGIAGIAAVYGSTFRVANYSDVFDASAQSSTSIGLHMARDGSHFYIGKQSGTLKVYSMSTSFLPSTASYEGSYSAGSTSKWDVEFNETGTRMFVQDTISSVESVKVFSLSVPWRPDTGTVTLLVTYDLNVSETDSTPTTGGAIQFSNSGKSFYYCPYALKSGNSSEGTSERAGQSFNVQTNSGVVYFWTLSTAYDLSSKSYQGYKRVPYSEYPSFGVTEDGKWLINGAYNQGIVAYYPIQTAWDITSINSADEVSFNHSTYASASNVAGQIASSWVGDNYYTIDYNRSLIQKYPWGPEQTTAAVTGSVPSGYNIAATNSGGQIDTSTWTDLNTMVADQAAGDGTVHYAVSTDDRTTWSVIKEGSGVRPIVRDNSGTWQYNSDAGTVNGYDISSPTFISDTGTVVSSYTLDPTGITFKPDGTKMYITNNADNRVNDFVLSIAWDVSTAAADTHGGVLGTNSQDLSPTGIQLKSDGTKAYVLGTQNYYLYQYSLTNAWDVYPSSYDSVSFSFGSQDTNVTDFFFKPDGTQLFLAGDVSNRIFAYSLGTAWDLSTMSYSNVSLDISSYETGVTGLTFSADGTKMFTVGPAYVRYWTLSTAWDISTASYSGNYDSSGQGTTHTAIAFKDDGTKMYTVIADAGSYQQGNQKVNQYTTGGLAYGTSTTWANSTTNDEFYALQEALGETEFNRMDKTQLDAVTDPNHYTLGDTLDLAIALRTDTASASTPTADGVTINYDAASLNQGAVLGTDYDYDFPNSTTVRVTSNAAQNLKIRVV